MTATASKPSTPPTSLQERSVLVKVSGAAFLRGVTVRAIFNLTDGGSLFEDGLCWVWNVALDPKSPRRDLRFWSREIIAPETCAGLTAAKVIAMILPARRENFPNGELVKLFQVDFNHIYHLKAEKILPPGEFTPRAALEKFLTERLIHK